MSDPEYLKNLKKYGNEEPTEDDIRSLEVEMWSGPDRGAAVVLASMAERAIERLVRNAMRVERADELFKFNGPLSSFSSKTQIAYAFKLIGPMVRHDLDIIRNIRNTFAHSRRPIKFMTHPL